MQEKIIKCEKGQALVEFAIVIPVFMFFLLIIIEFSWISYQRGLFSYGYNHAAWDITADKLSDMDPLKASGSAKTYTGSTVEKLIIDTISDSALWGVDTGNIKASNAVAYMYNKESSFDVPGRKAGEVNQASAVTRYMELSADLSYDIRPMTGFGQSLFGHLLHVEKDFSCIRVVGAQRRSE